MTGPDVMGDHRQIEDHPRLGTSLVCVAEFHDGRACGEGGSRLGNKIAVLPRLRKLKDQGKRGRSVPAPSENESKIRCAETVPQLGARSRHVRDE
jgi:hypothetical protein